MGKVERRVLTALFAPELSHARRGKGAFKGRRMPESRIPEGEERGGVDAAGVLGAGYCNYTTFLVDAIPCKGSGLLLLYFGNPVLGVHRLMTPCTSLERHVVHRCKRLVAAVKP